jgi:transposase-like protein
MADSSQKSKRIPVTLYELLDVYPSNEHCRQKLIQIRWPNGVICPRCECAKVSEVKGRKQWTCLGCRYRFSAVSGTVFENSKLALKKWFTAILLLIVSKKSQSSLQVNRQLGISQECCWHVLHRLREAMREGTGERDKFTGTVQMDEYYAAGSMRKPNRHATEWGESTNRRRESAQALARRDQQPVVGMLHVESGKVRTAHVPQVNNRRLMEKALEWCEPAMSELHSDEAKAYHRVGKQFAAHEVICHNREYVRPDGMNTNAVESVWSLFSRSIVGSFHRISTKHLPLYLAEFESRFNSRDIDHEQFFDLILKRSVGRKLPLRQLVGAPLE